MEENDYSGTAKIGKHPLDTKEHAEMQKSLAIVAQKEMDALIKRIVTEAWLKYSG